MSALLDFTPVLDVAAETARISAARADALREAAEALFKAAEALIDAGKFGEAHKAVEAASAASRAACNSEVA